MHNLKRFSKLLLMTTLVGTPLVGCKTAAKKPTKQVTQAKTKEVLEEVDTNEAAARHFAVATEMLKTDAGEGTLNKAQSELQRAVSADPKFASAHYNLGVIAEKNGDVQQAVQHYEQAFNSDPKMDLAVNNMGVILEATGQGERARSLYERAIGENKEAVHARLRLAKMSLREGDDKRATRLAREALQFDGKAIDAYRVLARVYAKNKKNTLARLIALRGQKLSPDDAELTYSLALVAQNDDEVALARELLRKVIASDKNHVEARVTLANLALKKRDWKTASTELEALGAMQPENPSIQNNLGLAYKGQGKFQEAKGAYEKAIAIDGDFAPSLLNLGILELRQLDNPEGASARLTRYTDLSSGKDAQQADKLLDEVRVMIEAKAAEKEQMAAMAAAEKEAARMEAEAEAAAKKAEEEAKLNPPPPEPKEEAPVVESPPKEVKKKAPRKPRKKRRVPAKKAEDTKEKKKAPESDEFFD